MEIGGGSRQGARTALAGEKVALHSGTPLRAVESQRGAYSVGDLFCTAHCFDELTGRTCFSFDLAYVDLTEGLAESKEDKLQFAAGQRASLSFLGYRVLPVFEPDPAPLHNEVGYGCETRSKHPLVDKCLDS